MTQPIPRVLSIAGTDPTGGAGIQADLKSISAHGGYGMAVVTALVAQNTHGVRSVHIPPAQFLREQLRAVSDDVTIDAVKIGMLGNAQIVDVVDLWLKEVNPPVVVVDPVMVATSGDRLLEPVAEEAVIRLLNRADLVTPNLAELGVLLREPTALAWSQALEQGHRLSAAHNVIVLVKGGHLEGAQCPDALVDATGGLAGGRQIIQVSAPRVATSNTHGTGCSMSSAMATLQARHNDWNEALTVTKAWLQDSLRHADDLHVGSGRGPIHHFHQLWAAGKA
ncbi:hydroxymethylpyrimidine kinase/phosphomethylpyrimidine kinase [Cryobacterium sp. CAN_C3]|uniref:bifunctional hydroxymethylpyrimidine kinase/phosphomethylpyrimidine kinase n=1 Tax=unclassified Cryobacterium TaxID=2649013 RepID=UPI001A1F4002|nr:hydroxymethylpyrimidine kinase/phosphomethylpyrimidine kinase [Cryobacterium sp. CAN_C3]